MPSEALLFWIFIFSGSLLAGWWLAVRPASTARQNSVTPVAVLLLIAVVLLCLLMVTGTSADNLAGGVYRALLRT